MQLCNKNVQQQGGPSHRASAACDLLQTMFPGRFMSKAGGFD